MRPSVSYVIPTRNRSKTIGPFLRKLCALSEDIPSEICVIDNASEDDTYETVKKAFPKVRLFRNNVNSGAEARNRGIRESRAGYICMLDDDSYPLEGAITGGINIMEKDAAIGCLAYRIMMPGGRYWTNGIYTTFAGCGALFRAKALRAIGGYPDGYIFYAEEYDVSFRLMAKGYRIVNCRDLIIHHEQITKGRDINTILSMLTANNIKLYSKFLPPAMACRQIDYELWRYRLIAEKENAMEGYVKGLELSYRRLADNTNAGYRPFTAALCRKMLGLDKTRSRISDFIKETHCRNTLIHTVGKLTPWIIEYIRGAGVKVAAIVENSPVMAGRNIEGIKIIPIAEARTVNFEAIICGSSSLSVNDSVEQAIRTDASFGNRPFLRICEYDY